MRDRLANAFAFTPEERTKLFALAIPEIGHIWSAKNRGVHLVNVVVGSASGLVPVAELQAAGVKRIRLGSAPYRNAMKALRAALKEAGTRNLSPIATGIGSGVKMILAAAAK